MRLDILTVVKTDGDRLEWAADIPQQPIRYDRDVCRREVLERHDLDLWTFETLLLALLDLCHT